MKVVKVLVAAFHQAIIVHPGITEAMSDALQGLLRGTVIKFQP